MCLVELEPHLAEFIAKYENNERDERMKEELLPEVSWLHSLKHGLVLGDLDAETSGQKYQHFKLNNNFLGGYAEYIAKRLEEENEHKPRTTTNTNAVRQ